MAFRADASDRNAEPGADLGVGQWRVGDEHGEQALAARRQPGERLAQRGGTLEREQLVLCRDGLLVWHVVQQLPVAGWWGLAGPVQESVTAWLSEQGFTLNTSELARDLILRPLRDR